MSLKIETNQESFSDYAFSTLNLTCKTTAAATSIYLLTICYAYPRDEEKILTAIVDTYCAIGVNLAVMSGILGIVRTVQKVGQFFLGSQA